MSKENKSAKSKEHKLVRYNLGIVKELFDDIQKIADNEGETFLAIITRFIKIGRYIFYAMKQDLQIKVIDKNGEEKNIIFM